MGTGSSIKIRRNRRQNAGAISKADFDIKIYMSLCRSQAESCDSKTMSVAQSKAGGAWGWKRWEGESLLNTASCNVLTKKGMILFLLLGSDDLKPCINQKLSL